MVLMASKGSTLMSARRTCATVGTPGMSWRQTWVAFGPFAVDAG